ncbi:MAG: putative Ig domain-containing protein, partial [Myxococcota bacterium]
FAGNNCTTSCNFTQFNANVGRRLSLVQDPGVELVSLGADVPQFATLGVPFQIPVVVANAHRNPLGPFEVRIVASRTRDGASPVTIGSTTIALAPFQTSTPSIEVTAPLSLGENSYYIFLEVDAANVVDEVDEANNTFRALQQIRFLPSRPDLRLDRVDLPSRQITAGDALDVIMTVTNAGSEPMDSTELAVMLSSNPVISANDGVLGSGSVTLAAGQTVTTTVTVTIPAGTNSGAYYIGALGDPMGMVDEISEANNGLAALNTIDVLGGTVGILTMNLPQALLQESYTALLSGTGGSGQYNWEVTQGVLPMGLGLVQSTGEFFGRPTTVGCEQFTVQVSDAQDAAASATQMLQLCVTTLTEPLTVVTRSIPAAIVGQEYSFSLVSTGGATGAAPEWSASGLPNGFALTSAGVLAGTADVEGSANVTVTVSNGMETATRELTLDIRANGNLQIQAEPLTVGRVGESYTYQFMSNGGIEPITWILALGSLSDIGLDLSPTGELSGIPTRAGRFRFTIEARDAGPPGRAARDENAFELVVQDDGSMQITTEALPVGNVNAGYDRAIAAVGGLPPYTWALSEGRLPAGLTGTTNPVTNEYRIAGTPTESVRANILVSATDSEGRTTSRAYVVDIQPEIIQIVEEDTGCSATGNQGDLTGLLVLAGFGLLLRRRRRD